MKQVVIIGSLSTQDNESQALQAMADFVAGAVPDSHVVFCHLDEVGYHITNQSQSVYDLRNNRDIADYDLVFFRGKLAASINIASTISAYVMQAKVPTINTAYAQRRAVGKLPQMMQLVALGLRIPNTVCAPNQYLAEFVKHKLTFPMVVKDVKGAHGNDNYLVNDPAELQRILHDNPNIEFMAQEYIPNDGDMRVLLVGPHSHMVIYRQGAADTHLNNTSQGGSARLLDAAQVNPDIIQQSRQFAQLCDYEIAGVDVMLHRDTHEHYFLEINSQPQLASGAFVDEKQQMLGKYLQSLLAD